MRKIISVFLTIGWFVPGFVYAQGTLYLSNLGVPSGGSNAIGSDSWLAAPFLTGTNSGGYDLNSIQLLMDAASGSPSGFRVSLYSDNSSSGSPESSLGSLSGSDPASGGIFTYTTSGLSLSPSTWYYKVWQPMA